MRTVLAFWRGELGLGRSFWAWGIVGGALVNVVATLVAVALLAQDFPGWVGALAFATPLPWNVGLVVGVWRSAAHAQSRNRGAAELARIAIVAWAAALSVV
jgi:hypothetical protein